MPGNWPSIRSIEESFATLILPTGDAINELRHLIDQCDIYRYEAILLTPYLVSFADLFGRKITDDQQLNDFFKQLNETALSDVEFAPKMAFVLASQQLGAHTPHETKVRNAMIETLQNNFVTFQQQQEEKDTQRFYNSLTLLGEYYNRKKIGYGQRINILGHALLSMLTSELEAEMGKACKQQQPPYCIDKAFAKLIAAQMSLNGEVMREDHPKEIKELTVMIRRCLITVPNLGKYTKAFLLMAIDIYHCELSQDLLEALYDKYIDQEVSEDPEPAAAASTVETESAESVPERKSKKSRSKDRKERKERKGAKESRESTDGSSRSGRSERSAAAEPSASEDPTQNPLSSDFDLDKYLAKYCPTVYEQISPERKGKTSRSKERSKEKKPSSSRSKKSTLSKEEHSTDKENKRRPSSRNDDSSPTRSHRHHRHQNGEGERSAEPANSTPPSSPASKKASSPQTTRTVTISERSPTREGARTDKLAQLPKITITTTTTVGTTSPTEKQRSDSGPTSPRGVLVASAKQPKSPTRDRARRSILDQQEEVPTKAKARSSLKPESRKVDRHRRAIETEPSGGGGRDSGKNVLKQHGNTTGASKHKTGRDTDSKKDRSGSRRQSDVSAKGHGGVAAPPPHGSDAEQEDSSPKVKQEHGEPESTNEKVSWYDLMMEDESPQKPNGRTESHPAPCLTSGE